MAGIINLENDMGLEATSKERKLNKHRIISIVCIFAFWEAIFVNVEPVETRYIK